MTKPILWLGPIEDLDAEFDPLLGRSAALPASKPNQVVASPMVDGRSVFDDPSEAVADTIFPAKSPNATAVSTTIDIADDNLRRESETKVSPKSGNEPDFAPEVTPNPDVGAMDFAHNNDPIPRGGGTFDGEEIDQSPPPKILLREAAEEVAPAPKKTLFARLFSPEAFVPIAAGTPAIGATIVSDADTLEPPKFEAAPKEVALTDRDLLEPDSDTALAGNTLAEIVSVDVAPEPFNAVQISDKPENEPSDPAAVDATLETEQSNISNEIIETQVAMPSDVADEMVIAGNVKEEEPPFELTGEQEAPLPPHAPVVDFKRAFDAENFWAIPKGLRTNDPIGEQAASMPDENNHNEDGDNKLESEDVSQPLLFEPSVEEVPPVKVRPDAPMRRQGLAVRRKKKTKSNYVAAFFGTFLIGFAAIMTLASMAAPLGYPFDMLSSFRWYWVTIAVVSAAIWGVSRGWKMVGVSFLVIAANLAVTIPATGKAPVGGKTATAVLGWANVGKSPAALARSFVDADKKQATLLMIADAPPSVFTPPAGWSLIEAPVAGDPTAIAVLSKSSWRAVTVPGEPTMARPPAGDLTVIGIHPQDAVRGKRTTSERLALINRAATRAGSQSGATIVFGDFNAPPWDKDIERLRSVGNVTRVRCGGWTGSTLAKGFGILGVAADHAFVRDVRVTHCQLGATLPGSAHKPIWLYVAPQVVPATELPDN